MDILPTSQDGSRLGFELLFKDERQSVLFLNSSRGHLQKNLCSKVKKELSVFFAKHDKFCNLQKARNYSLGRWVGYELLKDLFGYEFCRASRIVNSDQESSLGKPILFHGDKQLGHSISLSHCNHTSLAGFSAVQSIGVDLEVIRFRTDSFSNLLLTANEKLLVEHNKYRRNELLNVFWVGKEAVSKVVGRGLQIPLLHFEIELNVSRLYLDKMPCRLMMENRVELFFWINFFQRRVDEDSYTIAVASEQVKPKG